MPKPIEADLDELASEFELLGDWEERYRHLIDLGRALQPLTEDERTDANKVRGCASQVWLVTEPLADRRLRIRGDSDSSLVRGLIAVLLRLYAERAPSEILRFDVKGAFETLGFGSAISAQRSNGFFSMVERVRRDASELEAGGEIRA